MAEQGCDSLISHPREQGRPVTGRAEGLLSVVPPPQAGVPVWAGLLALGSWGHQRKDWEPCSRPQSLQCVPTRDGRPCLVPGDC